MPIRLLLRLQRTGLIALTYFGIAYTLVNSAAFPFFAGKTVAAQHAFGGQVDVLARQLAWLLPLPIHPETAAGYLQWRGYGVFAIVFAAWGVLAAAGAARRDEDRGLVELWLAAGMSRVRMTAARVGGFAAASAFAVTATGFVSWLGCLRAGFPVGIADIVYEAWRCGHSRSPATASLSWWLSLCPSTAPRLRWVGRWCWRSSWSTA